MRIAMFAPLLGLEATGLSLVATKTASHLAAAGHCVTLLGTDCGYRGAAVSAFAPVSPEVELKVFPVTGTIHRRLYRSAALLAWTREHIADFDVLDVQGLWSWTGVDLARLFHARGKPYILTPHGTMTRYDWRKGRLRRSIYFRTRLGRVWKEADAVRFLSTGERDQSFYPAQKGSIIANATDLLPQVSLEEKLASRQQLGLPGSAAVLLFLGRITHQKGVKEIVAAFEIAAQGLPNLWLCLVGPADGTYGDEVLAMIERSPVRERILVRGAVYGEARNVYFRAADAFITLSHNEGLSVAQLEALAHGLPAVLTHSSNIEYLEIYGAGVFTTHNPDQAAHAIVSLMADSEALAIAGSRARSLVQENFSWQQVVPQLASLYEQVLSPPVRAAKY